MICNHCGKERPPFVSDQATSHVCRACVLVAEKKSPGAPPLDPVKRAKSKRRPPAPGR
jgi:hypothetical protein